VPVLMFGSWMGPKRNLDHRSSSALVGILMSSSKLFLFSKEAHLNAGVRLLLELYIKHVAVFTI